MSKLHEVLAVLANLEGAVNKLDQETKKTFDKETLFSGQTRHLKMLDEAQAFMNHEEHQELTTTAQEVLNYLEAPYSVYWDAELRKEAANQQAKADIVLDGVTIAQAVPAQFLLGLESKLAKLRQLYDKIPTLPPGVQWEEDPTIMPGAFRTKFPETSFKTEKDPEFRVVVEATKEHPAQVERVDRTSTVGTYTTVKFNGKMKPVDKANMLHRIDKLLRAVKSARTRANDTKVDNELKLGQKLMDFINSGIL